MKSMEKLYVKIKGPILLVLITLGVYLCLRFLLGLVLPFLIAYFLAWIIRPVTESLHRRWRIPRILGGSAALLLLVAVFGTSICLLINILIKQSITFIRNLPIYMDAIAEKLDHICSGCDAMFGLDGGTIRGFVDENLLSGYNRLKANLMPELTEHTISITIWIIGFFGVSLIIFVSAVLIAKDLPELRERFEKMSSYEDIHKVTQKLSEAGVAYLRSQLIIMIIIAVICVLGLTLLKNNYAFLIGIGIAIMDALPVLGSGLVLVPWAIVMLVNGNIYQAAILVTIFLVCQVTREILEPKLIGNRIGVKPLFTLIAIYAGVKLFGFAGFFLGPIGLIIIRTVYQVIAEKAQEGNPEQVK